MTSYQRSKLLGIGLAVAAVAAACGSDPAEPNELSGAECVESVDTTITIFSGRTENLISPVLAAFECDTGIATEVKWGSSNDLALTIDTQGDSTEADVYLSRSPGPVGFLEGKDLLGELSGPTLDLVDDHNRGSAGTWIGFTGRKRVLVYNTDAVAADELPGSVLALTGEDYRGRVAIPATNGSFEDWFTVFRDQAGDDAATAWLTDMVANEAKSYPDNRSIVEAVGRGEIDMGLVNHYYNFQAVTSGGEDHRALNHDFDDDDIGSLLIITAATVLEPSDDKEAAEEFIAYLLSDRIQEYFAQETFEYPLAPGIEPAGDIPPLAALEVGSVDFDALGGSFESTERIISESGILNQ